MADTVVSAPSVLESALSLITVMDRVRADERMVLDMSEVRWASPAGLPAVRNDEALDGERLVALTRFADAKDVREVVRILENRIAHGDLRRSMQKIAAEAAMNVSEHAWSDHGYVAAQVYPSTSRLKLAIADSGVGILHTLAKRGARTDREALEMAITGHSERESGGGEGLRTMVRELKNSRGHGELVSGRAKINLVPGKSWHIRGGSFQGTIISVDLPASLDPSGQVVPSVHH